MIYYPYKGLGDFVIPGPDVIGRTTGQSPKGTVENPSTDWWGIFANSMKAFAAGSSRYGVAAPQMQNTFPATELIVFGVIGVLLVIAIK